MSLSLIGDILFVLVLLGGYFYVLMEEVAYYDKDIKTPEELEKERAERSGSFSFSTGINPKEEQRKLFNINSED